MTGTSTHDHTDDAEVDGMVHQRSSREPDELRATLGRWLAATLPDGAEPEITALGGTSANGMSSETLLFSAAWTGGKDAGSVDASRDHPERRERRLVARLAPDPADVPVFPSYDLGQQASILREVARCSAVPVPEVLWYEPDPAAIGAPFFVMTHVDGEIPPDVMPYTFGDCWLADATDEQRAGLQAAMVRVLADLHAIARPAERFTALAAGDTGATALERRLETAHAWYAFAADDGARSPLVERVFAWLDERRPAEEGPTVLSWGDARIGNVIFRDFEPVAVLDWEMAALGPPELDVAWMVYLHRLFQSFAEVFGRPGLPDFLRRDDVAAAYERLTGYTCRDLDFYEAFAAVQLAIVFLRTGTRQVHFGEIPAPDSADELIRHRDSLEGLLAGKGLS